MNRQKQVRFKCLAAKKKTVGIRTNKRSGREKGKIRSNILAKIQE